MSTPTNKNFLSPLNFKLVLKRTPYLNYFVQSVNLPGFYLGGPADFPTPFVNIPVPGDKLYFEPLNVTFKVDEDFGNYFEIYNWLRGLGFPDSFDQFNSLAEQGSIPGNGLGVYSDISLIVMTNSKNPNIEITFKNAFPTGISSITFDTTLSDVNFITATAIFHYTKYDVKLLT